ncbi:MAG: hypothetical protein LC105_02035 [Chitinophagales bacterium]|nr:hypothetical protein [Chitinophagales bacterium]
MTLLLPNSNEGCNIFREGKPILVPFGKREYIKTTVEDFPYKHDAEAKTLEIDGLKIWYEYVEEK